MGGRGACAPAHTGMKTATGDIDAALSAVNARLKAGAGLQEAFEDCAGFRFATAGLTARRIEMTLRARGVGDGADVNAAAQSVAWACALSAQAGCDAGSCLEAVRVECARQRDARRNADQALAMPLATVRILMALPLVTLLAGEAMGARPMAFLLGNPAGWGMLGVGAAFEGCGIAWMRWLVHRFGVRAGLAGSAGPAGSVGPAGSAQSKRGSLT
ncbi:tight adherence protein B [Pseudoscardovia suis]|uniref:Type II secretion system protein, pilus assembly n=2 Tax=Pseudoscardovia suis TaxID=987063 RepID=A0A261EVR1_9BIFI|nr:type II secretion system protein, pilus assembly [Pseudoscardovia suis]PJJ62733.1 tight adherence protein B [Pseudoscardovia suis]